MAVQPAGTILYVDDDATNRQAFAWLFRSQGYAVQEAATGQEALRLALDKPDLVVLDVNLPDLNGFEVCRRIKVHPDTSSIPVLHLSGQFVKSADRTQGLESGADGYLVKPVEPSEVLAQVRALLRIRRAEEAAQIAARQWQATFDALSDAVCLLDQNGCVVRCNRTLADLLRRPSADILGHAYLELVQQTFGPVGVPLVSRLQETATRQTVELPLGSQWFRLTVDPVLDNEGTVIGSVHLLADITERQHLEEQLRQAQKLEAIGRLAGGVAHDFNNLLTAITGNASLVRAVLPQEEPACEMVLAIEKAAWQAAELVQQLLSFSRQTKLRLKPIDLNQSITEMLGILRRTIDPRIVVELACLPELWLVHADPGQINQVLINLCLNARDAMPEGGLLLLETANVVLGEDAASRHLEARPGEWVRLRVQDTGHGIPLDVQPRIFEPFFSTKESGQGTGLGLATVFGIVKQHQGWIECASAVDEGTRFDLYLPRFHAERPAPSAPHASLTPGGHETILLVDDEAALRKLGQSILEPYGYQVLLAQDGLQAVEIYQHEGQRIDLVILDLTMPRLSGHDTLRQLLRINPRVRVLFASGYSADPMAESELEGVLGFISKPYGAQELANTVRTVLDQATAGRSGQ